MEGEAFPPQRRESHEEKAFMLLPSFASYFRYYQLRTRDMGLQQPSCDHEAEGMKASSAEEGCKELSPP